MKNLRITPKKIFVDSWGTGDTQTIEKFEIRRDFNEDELNKKIKYHPDVISKGVVIEELYSEDNAKMLLNALILQKSTK